VAQTLNDVTDAYSRVSVALIDEAEAIARGSFTNLGSWRDEDIPKFVNLISPSLTGLKRKASSASIAYMGQIAAINGKKFVAPSLDDIDISTAELRGGVNVDDVYRRPFVQMRMALAKNPTDVAAAIRTGSVAAGSLARTEVQLARRKASLVARKNNGNIVGYIRTLTGLESCALCYVASTQRYRKGDLLPIHPGCDCGEMPIYGSQDPGQVIDEFRLGKSHEAIKDRFGFAIAQARGEIDYRKVMIEDHGELGPLLTVKGHKFTGPNDLSLKGKKMPETAPKPVSRSVIAESIRKQAKSIDGAALQKTATDEFFKAETVVKYRGKSVPVAGPATAKALDDVLALGKTADEEIQKRVAEKIKSAGNPEMAKKVKKKIEELDNLETQRFLERDGYVADVASKAEALARSSNPLIDDNEIYLLNAFAKKQAKESAQYKKLDEAYSEATKALKAAKEELKLYELDDVAIAKIRRDEIVSLLDEVRGAGQDSLADKFKFVSGNKYAGEAVKHLDFAFESYPTDWIRRAVEVKGGKISTGYVQRGYYNGRGLYLSGGIEAPGVGVGSSATAAHEIGHMMEDVIPGLKALEWAFFNKRADGDYKPWGSGKEKGITDKWASGRSGNGQQSGNSRYQGRSYSYNYSTTETTPNDFFEIFTTGVESTVNSSRYFTYADGSVDEEFRQFVLGALFGL
jgi:hypothetical protein